MRGQDGSKPGTSAFQTLHLDPNVVCVGSVFIAIPLSDCIVLCNTLTQEQTAMGSVHHNGKEFHPLHFGIPHPTLWGFKRSFSNTLQPTGNKTSCVDIASSMMPRI